MHALQSDRFLRVASILYKKPRRSVSFSERDQAMRAVHDVTHTKRRSLEEAIDLLVTNFPHADASRVELRALVAPSATN